MLRINSTYKRSYRNHPHPECRQKYKNTDDGTIIITDVNSFMFWLDDNDYSYSIINQFDGNYVYVIEIECDPVESRMCDNIRMVYTFIDSTSYEFQYRIGKVVDKISNIIYNESTRDIVTNVHNSITNIFEERYRPISFFKNKIDSIKSQLGNPHRTKLNAHQYKRYERILYNILKK